MALLYETIGLGRGIGNRELLVQDELEIRDSCNRQRPGFENLTNTISEFKAGYTESLMQP
jgi:hypothetical protein